MVSPLCCQTVTLYHPAQTEILRLRVENCFYRYEDKDTPTGFVRNFLLVVPAGVPVTVGDRVLLGDGPEILPEAWQGFVPAKVEGLGEVAYVRPYENHTEAGRR